MNKLIVICGPTCTGKTSLAIGLCKKFDGEIVSADSRQIYKFMDIGTGKLPLSGMQKSQCKMQKQDGCWIVDGVYVHLYDVVEPDRKFSVARFKDAATKEIQSMWRRQKVPFLVGGTGFYVAAVLGEEQRSEKLKIGLTSSRETLFQRAYAWAEGVVNDSLLAEVKNLIDRGYKNTPPMQGIIYQTTIDHLVGKISKEEMLQKIKFDLHGYIRRQLTWFRRDKEIQWFDLAEPDCGKKVEKLVESFLRDG